MICFFQLVDLKAELYRKQEQFKREKLGQETADDRLKAKSTTNNKVSLSSHATGNICWTMTQSNFSLASL